METRKSTVSWSDKISSMDSKARVPSLNWLEKFFFGHCAKTFAYKCEANSNRQKSRDSLSMRKIFEPNFRCHIRELMARE